MVVDSDKHDFDNCPVCLGLAMVIRCDHDEYGAWLNRLQAKEAISWLEENELGDLITMGEYNYAYPAKRTCLGG